MRYITNSVMDSSSRCTRKLLVALRDKGLNVDQKIALTVWFRGKPLADFEIDLIVENSIVIELKATRNIDNAHQAQLLNYLRATEIEVGLLLNFGLKADFKRMAFDNSRKGIRENPRLSAAILINDDEG